MKHPATEELVAFLNSLVALDPEWMTQMVLHRPECNDKLLDHPTVQCGEDCAGLLGLLNGFCGIIEEGDYKGFGWIVAIIDSETNKVKGFNVTDPTVPQEESDLKWVGGAKPTLEEFE